MPHFIRTGLYLTHTGKRICRLIGGVFVIILLVWAIIGLNSVLHPQHFTAASKELGLMVHEVNQKIPDGQSKINTKLLYGVYIGIFKDNADFPISPEDIKSRLITCFYTSYNANCTAIESTETIFNNIEKEFACKILDTSKEEIINWAASLPDGYINGQALTGNLLQPQTPGEEPCNKNNIALVNFAWNALDSKSGYIYGAYGQPVTLDYLLRQQNTFAGDKEANLTDDEVIRILSVYAGHPSFDCVGLIKSYGWINEKSGDITYKSNNMPDVGANSIMKLDGLVWGDISTMPDIPGLAVQMDGHIGIYIGNGEVIEARGNLYGVVKTTLKGRGWQRWLEVSSITYEESGTFTIHGESVTLINREIQK